jgi:hypothetical protein
MGPLIALLVIATVSLLIVRVGATALMMTGLSWDSASFQSYSAFFGVGFTTREAEHVVNHPIRRRIIRDLILFGNVGLTSALATIIITFLDAKDSFLSLLGSLGLLAGGGLILFLLTKIGVVQRLIDYSIRRALESSSVLRVMDYDLLLHVQSGYCISEIDILEDHPLAGRHLGDSRPADQGIIVLGIHRHGEFTGTPTRHALIHPGDTLLVYGLEGAVQAFSRGSSSAKEK